MTEAEHDKPPIALPQDRDPIQAGLDYGSDMQMLKDNLARTPAARIRRHHIDLDTMQKLQEAKPVD